MIFEEVSGPQAPPPPTSVNHPPFSLPGLEALSARLRTTFINIGFFAAILMLLPSIVSQFSLDVVVIDAIGVPQPLAERGMTSDVVSNRIWDGLHQYTGEIALARTTFAAIPDNQLIQFSLPETGLSIDSMFRQMRQFFGQGETRISGEIICELVDCDPAGLRLRLRIVKGDTQMIDLQPLGDMAEADYFRLAASQVFEVLDPVMAVAFEASSNPGSARVNARRLTLGGHPDAKWAHNLLGDIAQSDGDPATALVEYDAALQLDPEFEIARLNLARTQIALGQYGQAQVSLSRTHDKTRPDLFTLYADLAIAQDRPDLAVTHLRAAARVAPLDASILARLGALEWQSGDKDAALRDLSEALEIDPAARSAIDAMTEIYRGEEKLDDVERVIRNWADYAPDDIDAQLALAELLVERVKYEEAILAYDRAIELEPTSPAHATARADVLLRSLRHAEAIDSLLPLADSASPDPAAVLLLADAYKNARQARQAAQRYQQFLSLLPGAGEAPRARAALLELKAILSQS